MRTAYVILVVLFTILLLVINTGVRDVPQPGSSNERAGISAQLAYLRPHMATGLPARMQQLFPEGCMFTHALYALTLCRMASTEDENREVLLAEAISSYRALDRAEVKAPFPKTMIPAHGVFYAGWRNHLLAAIIEAHGDRRVDDGLMAEFDRQTQELVDAYAGSASPFLQSYQGMAWPADNVVAMSSVAMHQRLRSSRYGDVISTWLGRVIERGDTSGLIPHAWDPVMDVMQEGPRGSSQSLMNCFLQEIDRGLAAKQFGLYRSHFLDTVMGVPMVREYPKGAYGVGDVDSGPVIFGAGSSATIVGPGAFRRNGDPANAFVLDAVIEGFGFAYGHEHKRYVAGVMPVADLFICWTRSMSLDGPAGAYDPSFAAFHGWSVFWLLVLWAPIGWSILRRKVPRKTIST